MLKLLVNIMSIAVFFTSGITYAETAKNVWNDLIGVKAKDRPMYAYQENDTALPNVLIYGDSISINYTQDVRKAMKDKANVYRLHRNGGSSALFIANMDKMHNLMTNKTLDNYWSFNWDVVHFNVGLHDLKYLFKKKLNKVEGKQVSTTDEYKKNLTVIVLYLKKAHPNAKLIFATTTPIPEGEPGRKVGDAVKYNAAAMQVLEEFPEISINDLYNFTKPNHHNWQVKPGDVHYNKQGAQAHGKEVARVISQSLTIK